MIEFSGLYILGCLIALPIGIYLINEFDKSEKPTYDLLDEEIKTSINRMTMFMIIVSSWIVVIGFLLFKGIKHILTNKKTS